MANTPATNNGNSDAALVPRNPAIDEVVARAQRTGHYVGGASFVMQALDAVTIEEATNIGTVLSGKEMTGQRLKFLGCSFLDSDPELDGDIPLFALCDVVPERGDGEVVKMSIGAGHVVGLMIRAHEMGWFPFDAELVPVPLGKGKTAINLQLAPRRVEALEEL